MDHGGVAARPTALGSTNVTMVAAIQRGEANAYRNSAEFARQVRAAAERGEVPIAVFNREPGPGVAYANNGELRRQPGSGPAGVVLVGVQLPDGVVPAHDNYGYSPLLPAMFHGVPGGPGVVYADVPEFWRQPGPRDEVRVVPVHGYYALQPRPGAGRGEVLVDLLPDGAGAAYDNYCYYELQPRPATGRGDVPLLADGVGAAYDNYGYYDLQPRRSARGEVRLLPGGIDAYDNYYVLQPRPDVGRGDVLVNLIPDDGAGVVYDNYSWPHLQGAERGEVLASLLPDGVSNNSGNFAQQALPGTGRADGISGALGDPSLDYAGYDGSGALLADGVGTVYHDRGTVAQLLRRLLPFAGLGTSSVAVNGLSAGPGSPAAAFHLFVLLLGGLSLVMLHVLRE